VLKVFGTVHPPLDSIDSTPFRVADLAWYPVSRRTYCGGRRHSHIDFHQMELAPAFRRVSFTAGGCELHLVEGLGTGRFPRRRAGGTPPMRTVGSHGQSPDGAPPPSAVCLSKNKNAHSVCIFVSYTNSICSTYANKKDFHSKNFSRKVIHTFQKKNSCTCRCL
jgi:hypothetical protein